MEPLEEAQRPLKEALEPITELEKEVRSDMEGIQKSFSDIGKPVKAEKEGREPRSYSRNEIARKVDISPVRLALKLHEEYYRCFELKNEKTTQDQTTQKKEADS